MFLPKKNVIPWLPCFAAHDFRGEVVAENPFTGRKILKKPLDRRPIFQTPQSIKIQVLAFLPLSSTYNIFTIVARARAGARDRRRSRPRLLALAHLYTGFIPLAVERAFVNIFSSAKVEKS